MKERLRDMLEEVIWLDMTNFTIIGYHTEFPGIKNRVREIGRIGVQPIILTQAESSAGLALVNGIFRIGFNKGKKFF
jgi:hypothetical protein